MNDWNPTETELPWWHDYGCLTVITAIGFLVAVTVGLLVGMLTGLS